MLTKSVRCHTCRGQKEVSGIGGVTKPCWNCDGTGKTQFEVMDNEVVHTFDEFKSDVKKLSVEEVETLDMFDPHDAIAPLGLVDEAISSAQIDKNEKGARTSFKKKEQEIVDPTMEAILAESKMNSEDWKAKYPIAASIDVRDRHNMRVMYAQAKPIEPRRVDLGKMQDNVSKSDPEHLAFLNREKALLEKEAAKNKAKVGSK